VSPPTIVIDTREQRPWSFSVPTKPGTLASGDYSIEGCEHLFAVERKAPGDLNWHTHLRPLAIRTGARAPG
jgi:ERCC4-type nuclease